MASGTQATSLLDFAIDELVIDKLGILSAWIKEFILSDSLAKSVGRAGTVCPFCPRAKALNQMKIFPIRGKKLFPDVKALLLQFRDLFLAESASRDDVLHFTFILAFPDIENEECSVYIDGVQRKAKPYFTEKGLMIGEFHPLNESPGIHNESFRPLKSPIPLLVIRYMLEDDLRFLDYEGYPTPLRIQFVRHFLASFPKRADVQETLIKLTNGKTKNEEKVECPVAVGIAQEYWTILYGTQTGTAKEFALNLGKCLHTLAAKENKTLRIVAMDNYPFEIEFLSETFLLIISSTYGAGDPPCMGIRFKQYLRRLTQPCKPVKGWNSKFAVLGLGSSNFKLSYCQWPKDLQCMLTRLGGSSIIPLTCIDSFIDNQRASFREWFSVLLSHLDPGSPIPSESHTTLWKVKEYGVGKPRSSRVSTRVESRHLLDLVVRALHLSHGSMTGISMVLKGAANLLQSSIGSDPVHSRLSLESIQESDSITSVLQNVSRTDDTTRTYDIMKVFDAFDQNADGIISLQEFEFGLKQLGVTPTHEELSSAISILDSNHDGMISLVEFFKYVQQEGTEDEMVGRILESRAMKSISRQYPFFAPLVGNVELFSSKSARSCRLLRFDVTDYGAGTILSSPGDHVGIFPENDPQGVYEVIKLLGISNADINFKMKLMEPSLSGLLVSPFPTVISYWQALSCYIDLSSAPSALMCKVLAPFCTNADERFLLELYADETDHNEWVVRESPTMISFLKTFGSIDISQSLGIFFQYAPAMQPRFYSVCCSQLKYPNEIHICVSHLSYKAVNGDFRFGVCSDFLRKHCPSSIVDRGIALPIFKSSSTFRLPDDTSVPVVMVAAGTGLAPFRSFWQEREAMIQNDKGKSFGRFILYYGCKSPEEHIFRDELELIRDQGDVGSLELHVAYSQVGTGSKRVTSDLQRDAMLLLKLFQEENGTLYICGENKVANSVRSALQDEWAKNSVKEDILSILKQSDRLHEEIFGGAEPRRSPVNKPSMGYY